MSVASTTIIIGLLASLQISGEQKPVVEFPIFVDYVQPPSTFKEFASAADLVLTGSIASTRYVVESEAGRQRVSTDVQFTIAMVVKGSGVSPGGTVTILRTGGDLDVGDTIRRSTEQGFPRFQVGEQYLLLLHWNPALSVYNVMYGPNGAFQIASDMVRSLGVSRLSQQYDGRLVSTLIEDIRRGMRAP